MSKDDIKAVAASIRRERENSKKMAAMEKELQYARKR